MILIQDGSQNTNVDKPLRIIGDPYKVQVGVQFPGLGVGSAQSLFRCCTVVPCALGEGSLLDRQEGPLPPGSGFLF